MKSIAVASRWLAIAGPTQPYPPEGCTKVFEIGSGDAEASATSGASPAPPASPETGRPATAAETTDASTAPLTTSVAFCARNARLANR